MDMRRYGNLLYLLELFDINVELAAQLGLGMGESGNLGSQSSATVGLNFTCTALIFKL